MMGLPAAAAAAAGSTHAGGTEGEPDESRGEKKNVCKGYILGMVKKNAGGGGRYYGEGDRRIGTSGEEGSSLRALEVSRQVRWCCR